MIYYTWFYGSDRATLVRELQAGDPFDLEPADIVERIVAAGFTPWVEAPQAEPVASFGLSAEVEREGLVYLVCISRKAEAIHVQERRAKAYVTATDR